MRNQQGFTLIELMIVVAIIGILAAIAIPAYQDYTIRTKISEVMVVASAAKNSASEYYISTNNLPADSSKAGINTVAAQSNYLSAISVDTLGGTINLYYTLTNLGTDVNGKSLIFNGTGSSNGVKWVCTSGNLDQKFRAANCRT